MAMQALREYGERITNRDIYNMRVRLEATSTPNWERSVHLQRGNFHDFHSFSVRVGFDLFVYISNVVP